MDIRIVEGASFGFSQGAAFFMWNSVSLDGGVNEMCQVEFV